MPGNNFKIGQKLFFYIINPFNTFKSKGLSSSYFSQYFFKLFCQSTLLILLFSLLVSWFSVSLPSVEGGVEETTAGFFELYIWLFILPIIRVQYIYLVFIICTTYWILRSSLTAVLLISSLLFTLLSKKGTRKIYLQWQLSPATICLAWSPVVLRVFDSIWYSCCHNLYKYLVCWWCLIV